MKPAKILSSALACLQHPLTWGAILLLLLNDQVLKYSYPSWWTGKLSDFAGLFFFPFVVTLILTVLLRPFSVSERKTGTIAFGLIAVWFTLMKTAPLFNLATEFVWSQLVGYPVQIVQDPADLLALLALWPAWRLWQNQLTRPGTVGQTPALNWLSLAFLAIGTFASLASSCDHPPRIDKIVFNEGAFYVRPGYSQGHYARLVPGEEVWEEFIPSVSAAVAEQFVASRTLPIVACLTQQPNICYRVEGKEQVLASEDGGETWRVEWEIPAGRRQFMARFPQGCGGYLDMGPYDLAVAETDEGHYVVVAMGTEGVLVRQDDGRWVQQTVLDIEPTPLRATTMAEIYAILKSEFTYLILLAAGISLTLFLAVWKRPGLIIKLFLWALVVQFLGILIGTRVQDVGDIVVGMVVTVALYFPVMMIGAYIFWIRESHNAPHTETSKTAGHIWFLMGFGIVCLGMLPFVLWTTGVIVYYESALRLSILFTLLTIIASFWSWRRIKVWPTNVLDA